MARLRCVNCRGYYPKEAMLYRAVVAVCSEECLAEWQVKKRAKHHVKDTRPKAVKKAAPKRKRKTNIPAAIRYKVRERDNELCKVCQRRGTQVHHVVFRSAGGIHVEENLVLLCFRCHQDCAHGAESRLWRRTFQAWLYCYYTQGQRVSLGVLQRALEEQAFLDDVKAFVGATLKGATDGE